MGGYAEPYAFSLSCSSEGDDADADSGGSIGRSRPGIMRSGGGG